MLRRLLGAWVAVGAITFWAAHSAALPTCKAKGRPAEVFTSASESSLPHRLASFATGAALVHSDGNKVRVHLLSAAGRKLKSLELPARATVFSTSVASNGKEIAVVWNDEGRDSQLGVAIYTTNGNEVVKPQYIARPKGVSWPEVVAAPDGTFLVSWQSLEPKKLDATPQVEAAKLAYDGGAPSLAATAALGNSWLLTRASSAAQRGPTMVAAWAEQRDKSGGVQVMEWAPGTTSPSAVRVTPKLGSIPAFPDIALACGSSSCFLTFDAYGEPNGMPTHATTFCSFSTAGDLQDASRCYSSGMEGDWAHSATSFGSIFARAWARDFHEVYVQLFDTGPKSQTLLAAKIPNASVRNTSISHIKDDLLLVTYDTDADRDARRKSKLYAMTVTCTGLTNDPRP